jgi:hypothetical protein
VVQYVQGTATDAPTIAPGPVMHSCPQHQNGGSASLGVWEGWPGVRECWAGAGQELGRQVSAWVPVWVPCTCMNCSQLHASHASRDTDTDTDTACLVPRTQARNNVLKPFFTLSLLATSPHWRKKARRVGVDCGSWKTLGPSPSTSGSTVGQMFARASGAVLKEANPGPIQATCPQLPVWLTGNRHSRLTGPSTSQHSRPSTSSSAAGFSFGSHDRYLVASSFSAVCNIQGLKVPPQPCRPKSPTISDWKANE